MSSLSVGDIYVYYMTEIILLFVYKSAVHAWTHTHARAWTHSWTSREAEARATPKMFGRTDTEKAFALLDDVFVLCSDLFALEQFVTFCRRRPDVVWPGTAVFTITFPSLKQSCFQNLVYRPVRFYVKICFISGKRIKMKTVFVNLTEFFNWETSWEVLCKGK